MKTHKRNGHFLFTLTLLLFVLISFQGSGQDRSEVYRTFRYPQSLRSYDSIRASKLPVLKLPESCKHRSLPPELDNSQSKYFPGIRDQHMFFTCQQFAAVEYTYAYEINRMRDTDGKLLQNRYPAQYTWTFMNDAEQYKGVSFFYSFDVIRQQGHPTMDGYGEDDSMKVTGWMTGYEKYYSGMHNRLNGISMIPVNSPEGILTVRHYLHDHLVGSPVGGVCFFDASSAFTTANLLPLPPGTPEEGKDVLIGFYPVATHGMTIVGYNDSIRYDINGDGKYTNDIDINGDGEINARDWEIGAFRIANSYGDWWSDEGYFYILYRAFALDYDASNAQWAPLSGVWNHCVFVVDPDTGYHPVLTMKTTISSDSRNKIRIRAGIALDTMHTLPEKTIAFPIFSFMGGDHYMQGTDTLPEFRDLELGLDITPLLGEITPGKPARFFLSVENRDPDMIGYGEVKKLSFIDYTDSASPVEFSSPESNVPVGLNNVTVLSAVRPVTFDKVAIQTTQVPPYLPPEPFSVQLQASGGTLPYLWSLLRTYEKNSSSNAFASINQNILTFPNIDLPFVRVILPFHFPFYGRMHDTIYVNMYGFIAFDNGQYPYPYLTDEEGMLKRIRCISPAFTMDFEPKPGACVWYESHPDWAGFRWRLGSKTDPSLTEFNFLLKIYKNGEFEFLYGNMLSPGHPEITATGFSMGDEQNAETWTNWDLKNEINKSYLFHPAPLPEGITLEETGLLSVTQADSSLIYDVPVMVTDRNRISDHRTFSLSGGLGITEELVSAPGDRLVYGRPASFTMHITNNTTKPMNGVTIILNTTDTTLRITDSLVHINSIQPGETVTRENCFSFSLKYRVDDQFPVSLGFSVATETHHWMKDLRIPVFAPRIECSLPEVEDGENQILDPGEVADLAIPLKNSGSVDVTHAEVMLIADDSLISVISGTTQVIDTLKMFSSERLTFRVRVSQIATPGQISLIRVKVQSADDTTRLFSFNLKVGKIPVAIIRLASNTQSDLAMKLALDSLKAAHVILTAYPVDLSEFSAVFIILGTYPGNHVLTDDEGHSLEQYLLSGGNLYMEGYSTWYYQKTTKVHPYFKYTSVGVPGYYFRRVSGVGGEITDSMDFRYTATANYAVFSMVPKPPAFSLLQNTDTVPRCLEVAYQGGDYKTIGTMLEFSELKDSVSPSDKYTLMKRYLEFFDVNYTGPFPLFHTEENNLCKGHPFMMYDDSFDNIVSRTWEFPGGTPSQSAEQNPRVTFNVPGRYDVKLTVSDGIHTRSVLKKQYIHVNECAGENSEQPPAKKLLIYPNPSGHLFWIEIPGRMMSELLLQVYSINGKLIHSEVIPQNTGLAKLRLNCTSFPDGLYIIRIVSRQHVFTGRVLVQH